MSVIDPGPWVPHGWYLAGNLRKALERYADDDLVTITSSGVLYGADSLAQAQASNRMANPSDEDMLEPLDTPAPEIHPPHETTPKPFNTTTDDN